MPVTDLSSFFPTSLCHRCDALRFSGNQKGTLFFQCKRRPERYFPQPVYRCAHFVEHTAHLIRDHSGAHHATLLGSSFLSQPLQLTPVKALSWQVEGEDPFLLSPPTKQLSPPGALFWEAGRISLSTLSKRGLLIGRIWPPVFLPEIPLIIE